MPYNGSLHLFAILTDPDEHDSMLAAMVTSVKPGRAFDKTCILNVGDHRFIKHESYIAYVIAETPRVMHVHNMIRKNSFICDDDFSQTALERITDGVFDSPETKDRIYNYAYDAGI